MRTLDALAAIGVVAIVYVGCKIVLAVDDIFNGPRKVKNSRISFKTKMEKEGH